MQISTASAPVGPYTFGKDEYSTVESYGFSLSWIKTSNRSVLSSGGGLVIIRILVVDDFVPWRRFVSSILRGVPNWQVVCEASDGPEAVKKAQELKPDLILLDIGLPKLNGIEAARRIRKLAPNSTILFLSAHDDLDIAGKALDAGASGYVVKSDAETELLRAVQAAIQANGLSVAG